MFSENIAPSKKKKKIDWVEGNVDDFQVYPGFLPCLESLICNIIWCWTWNEIIMIKTYKVNMNIGKNKSSYKGIL